MKELRQVSRLYWPLLLTGPLCSRSQRTDFFSNRQCDAGELEYSLQGLFSPFLKLPFSCFKVSQCGILSVKKVKSKHIRNERNAEIL